MIKNLDEMSDDDLANELTRRRRSRREKVDNDLKNVIESMRTALDDYTKVTGNVLYWTGYSYQLKPKDTK